MKHLTGSTLFGVGALALASLLLAAPETVLAGAGGTEFQGAYDMLSGWMTSILGRIIGHPSLPHESTLHFSCAHPPVWSRSYGTKHR
jgi:hypothetical protein